MADKDGNIIAKEIMVSASSRPPSTSCKRS